MSWEDPAERWQDDEQDEPVPVFILDEPDRRYDELVERRAWPSNRDLFRESLVTDRAAGREDWMEASRR